MRKLLQFHLGRMLLLAAMVTGMNSWGQINMASTGSNTQSFNGLASTGTNTWTSNSTIPNWYSQRSGSGTSYVADNGNLNGGNLYSYGTTGSSDRALGSLGSSNAAAGNFAHGVLLRNTSGGVINDIKVTYTLEQWRNGGANAAQALTFYYRTSSSTITSLQPNVITGWTQVTGLTLNSPVFSVTAAPLDGNTNKVTASNVAIPGLTLANNDYIMLKWEDPDNSGSDHGLAIDDVTISWTTSAGSLSSPSLTAALSATVDNPFNITFTDDAAWRSAITSITIDGTEISSGAYNKDTASQITFTPSGSTLLQTPGTKTVVIYATGYTNATVSQDIGFGAASKLVMVTQPAAPAANGNTLATQPELKVTDQYGNTVTNSTVSITATANTSAGSWTLGGTVTKNAVSGILNTYTNLTATSTAALTGVSIDFTSTGLTGVSTSTFNIPAPVPTNDACSASVPSLTVGGGATSGTLVAAGTSSYTGNSSYKDVWYTFTASCSGTHSILVNNFTSTVNAAVFAFPNSCPTNSTDAVASVNAGGNGVAEILNLTAVQGTTYYIRVATTSGGEGTFNIQVSSVAAGPTVSTAAVSGLTSTSVTLNGSASVTGCSSALYTTMGSYGFEYSLINNFVTGTGTVAYSNNLSNGTFSGSITSLGDGQTYYYRSFATNDSGKVYSSQSSFATPCVTPTAVTSLTPAYPVSAQVTLSWSNGTCFDEVLVVAKLGSAVTAIPSGDGTAYTANAAFGSGTAIAAGEYVVYKNTGSTVAVTALTNGLQYHFAVFTRKGSAWSSAVTTIGYPVMVYCTPTYSSGVGSNGIERVASVTLGTLSQTTANSVTSTYINYTATQNAIPDLTIGSTVNVTVTFGGDATQYSGVWVDFNNDGTFGNTEFFSLGTNAGSNGTAIIPVTVPQNATLGQVRLRVRGGDDAVVLSTHGCGASASNYGQAQDYKVNIIVNTLPIVTTVSSSATGYATATATGNVTNEGTSPVSERGIVYGTSQNPTIANSHIPNGSGLGSFSVNLSGLTDNTTYYARAYATNTSGTSYGANTSFTTTSISLPSAQEESYLDDAGIGFVANWDAMAGATGYELDVATSNIFSGSETKINETFEAANLNNWSNIPNWTVDTNGAITGQRSARLNAPSSQSTQYISTTPTAYDVSTGTTTWRLNVKVNYDPSGNNNFRFFLMSDNSNLVGGSASGYAVGITGSDSSIKLWKYTSGSVASTLITSSQSFAQGDTYGIEVIRTKAGVWTLKTKSGGGFTGMTTASVSPTDATYTTSTYSGMVSATSSSNRQNFRFDDFSIQFDYTNMLEDYDPMVIAGGNVTKQSVTGLTLGNTYYYRVRAVGANSTSANSNVITATAKQTNVWNGTAWTAGTPPTNLEKAVINDSYNTSEDGELTAASLDVNGGTFTITDGDNVTITNEVVVDNDLVDGEIVGAQMVIENNANLIQVNDVDNTGNITVEQLSAPMFRLDYSLWSSPVSGETLIGFSPETLSNRFYHYNPVSDAYAAVDGSTEFVEGISYLIRVENTHPAYDTATNFVGIPWEGSYTGVPNNGNVIADVTTAGFNAVGNPYPSPINIAAFYSTNQLNLGDNTALYFWRKKNGSASSSYASLTLDGYIANGQVDAEHPEIHYGDAGNGLFANANDSDDWVLNPGQGFIVESNGNDIVFNNAMRVPVNNNQQFRTAQDETPAASRLWLNLNAANGEYHQAMVSYSSSATLGLDYARDGKALTDSDVSLYSFAGESMLGIQARPSFENTDEVPMGYKVATAGTYTISLDHMDGVFAQDQDIYLRDNLLEITHDLKQGAYEFATEGGTFAGRFDVIYVNEALGTNNPSLDANSVIVYKQGSSIVISSGAVDMTAVSVYDMRGRLLYCGSNINATETVISGLQAEKQVLIVNVSTLKGDVSKKIVF